MKNITRTIRVLSVEYPVKAENGFETRHDTIIDNGAAAIRAELKRACMENGVKFLGEYDVVNAEEHVFSMSVERFAQFAEEIN